MTTTTKQKIPHSLGASLNYPDRMCVRVDAGLYEGTVFSVAKLYFDEDADDFVCNYDIELYMENGKQKDPKNLDKFSEEAARPIMNEFIEDIANKTLSDGNKPKADAL